MPGAGAAGEIHPAIRAGIARTLAEFPRNTRDRGIRYAREGRVRAIEVSEAGIEARVRGHALYTVRWEPDPDDAGEWSADCSCPVGLFCKHAFAVATVLMGGGRVGTDESDEDLFEDDEEEPFEERLSHSLSRVARTTPWTQAAPRPPQNTTLAMLHVLRSEHDAWKLRPAADFLARRSGIDLATVGRVLEEARLSGTDPDLRCWRLVQAILAHAPEGSTLCDVLEPYRDRPDLAAAQLEHERTALRIALRSLGTAPGTDTKRSLRLVVSFEPRGTRVRGTLQVLLSTRRLVDAPRSAQQLEQLRSELRANPEVLPREQADLLRQIADCMHRMSPSVDLSPSPEDLHRILERAVPFGLARFDERLDADLARRAGVTPGTPIVLAGEPAALVPHCVDGADGAELRLVYRWGDGRIAELDDAVHLRAHREPWQAVEPSLVVAHGEMALVTTEPPEDLVARFRAVGSLALEPGERLPFLLHLAKRWPHLRDTVAAHTELVAVTPVAALDLREDDWLQVRLLAVPSGDSSDADPSSLFEYLPEGAWGDIAPAALPPALRDALAPSPSPPATTLQRIEEEAAPVPDSPGAAIETCDPAPPQPAAVADPWARTPDPSAVGPLLEWLESLRATPGGKRAPGGVEPPWPDRGAGFWLRVTQKRVGELFEAWTARPRSTTFLGNERARRLLDPKARAFAKLRVTASGVDLLAIRADWQSEGAALTAEDVAALRQATTRFVRLRSGWVRRDVASIGETERALADLGVEAGLGEQDVSIWQLAGARPESLALLEGLGADPETMRALDELRRRIAEFRGLPRVRLPRTIRATLRPYQRDGLDFLAHASELGTGAILADDMGLGKTVQALAWLEHLRRKEPGGGPSLVVCPASVVHNWRREAARFVPSLRVLVLERGGERHALRRDISEHDLVITNYALLRRDAEHWHPLELRAVILDEAQNVKNPDAAVTRAVLGLRARHRVALTGTPLENRPLDLWSILSFVCPGYLGNRTHFGSAYDRPDLPPHRRQLLAARLRPVLLRRLKRDVAQDLPERIEERRDCELTAGQRRLYLAELARCRDLVGRLEQEEDGLERNRIVILAALTRLRQVCCHPALAGGKRELGSGKFEALFELLEPLLAEGHKVLLFSQFVECLKLLERELRTRRVTRFLLTGQTVQRERVVQEFTEHAGPAVFLLSLKAGGTGLNLTAASYVVLFDPWWNPAVEAQAIDRSHRIGQDRTVIAYRLLSRGTIEEKIAELQERKAALVRDILGDGSAGRALSRDDLQYLLAGDDVPGEAD